jgi:hypothetical protein
MGVIDTILEKLRHLSAEDQQRVLEAIKNLPPGQQPKDSGSANGAQAEAKPSIWAKLQALSQESGETPCDLPSDLAANHDFYLHHLPRRS